MEQASVTLPARLLPRKSALIFLLCFFTFFFAFAVFWTIMVADTSVPFSFNDVPVTDPKWRALAPLWGIPFILVGLGGVVCTIPKMLPGSPYFHVDLSPDGILVRGLFKQQNLAWRDIYSITFDEQEGDESTSYYVVVLGYSALPAKRREEVRIPMDQYGTKNKKDGAIELAAWLERFRDLATRNELNTAAQFDVPSGFARYVVTLPATGNSVAGTAPAERTPTVVRR